MENFYTKMSYVYLLIALYCYYIEEKSHAHFFVAMILFSQIKAHLYRIEEKINESK